EQRLSEIERAMASGRLVVEAVPGGETRPERGRLTFLDNTVDRTTGTIRLKGTFPNPTRRLWPGQFVSARLTLSVRSGAVVVPSQALQSGQSGRFVFVVKPDLTAEPRPVATTLVMLAILVAGIGGYALLPVSDLPNVDFPTLQVSASLPGASPETMAASVATPLEREFSTIAGIDSMTSASFLGTTSITVQFTLS